MRMNGKVCVVTGGARGIGKEIVTKFANEGALVVFACDMNKEALDELEKEFKNVKGYILNVTDREGIKVFVEKVRAEYGRIDALVNNAGITRDA
ncbi:MAG TPA: SDR family NAD(P)-dependent oxidoreductase, partial [Petrotogaceae bacterium]|nr:SDR family NAD(P)-dependent oxidoreductase [Petrotogaceae bacterium]